MNLPCPSLMTWTCSDYQSMGLNLPWRAYHSFNSDLLAVHIFLRICKTEWWGQGHTGASLILVINLSINLGEFPKISGHAHFTTPMNGVEFHIINTAADEPGFMFVYCVWNTKFNDFSEQDANINNSKTYQCKLLPLPSSEEEELGEKRCQF